MADFGFGLLILSHFGPPMAPFFCVAPNVFQEGEGKGKRKGEEGANLGRKKGLRARSPRKKRRMVLSIERERGEEAKNKAM